MSTVRVHVKSYMNKFANSQQRELDMAVLRMATDIHRQASVLAPKDTRALVNSGTVNRQGNAEYSVSFGGGSVPYAARRHWENYRNPHTLKYLERAGRNVINNPGKYLPKV